MDRLEAALVEVEEAKRLRDIAHNAYDELVRQRTAAYAAYDEADNPDFSTAAYQHYRSLCTEVRNAYDTWQQAIACFEKSRDACLALTSTAEAL